jgi:DUF4097 and DUF4098 domain-containing protein YvlB
VRDIRRYSLLVPVALATLAVTASAQRDGSQRQSAQDWLADCRRGDREWSRDREQACDVRETTLPARGGRLNVDGGENGGVAVYGWDRNEIKIVAKIQAQARSRSDAEALLRDIAVRTSSDIRAEGPRNGRNESWSVSFEVYAPRHADLDLRTNNGGIAIADVDGDIRFDAVNGGVRLTGLAGDVRGGTQNGGVHVALAGDRWRGQGLDVRTQNGGVRIDVPDRYNAQLETGTVNGRFDLDFPVTVSGRLGRRISTQLGSGGPAIRVMTTNGGVSLRRL